MASSYDKTKEPLKSIVVTGNCANNQSRSTVMKPAGAYYTPLTFTTFWILISSSFFRTGLLATNLAFSFDNAREPLKIIVIVPTTKKKEDYCNGYQPEWERGEEILPGAYIALSEINNSPNLHKLDILPIVVPQCSITAKVDAFVGNLTSKRLATKPIAIIGYFCDNLAYFISQLAGRERFGVIQISATLPLRSSLNPGSMKLHHMLPSPVTCAKAAVMLCRELGWSHVGVIGLGLYHDTHFSRIREEFLNNARKHNITIVFQMERTFINLPSQILKELKQSIAKVIVVFLPPSEAVNMLCEAYNQGLAWPDYVWLYVEIDSDTLTIRDTSSCTADILKKAMEKILFLHLQTWQQGEEILHLGDNYHTFRSSYYQKLKDSECLQSNTYASVLYDSIWAIALAVNRSQTTLSVNPVQTNKHNSMSSAAKELTTVSFQGASGLVNFSQRAAALQLHVDIFQVYQNKSIQIGTYNQYTDSLFINLSILGDIPNDELDKVYLLYPLYLTVILLIFLISSLAFTTITMSLFIHYRKNPEIRATSSILSLCMFVGCYCLIISSLLHTIASGLVLGNTILGYADCWGNTFLFTVGLDIVLATLFTKTLRIYHIFNTFGKLSSLWSDKSLFAIILSIVSGKVLIMVIWAVVDMNHLIDKTTLSLQRSPPYYEVVQKCYSQHLGLWVAVIFAYTALLFLPMITAAILTRRIKGEKSRYKDSKKICMLVAVLFILICMGNALWFFLRAIGANIASKVVFSLGFTLAALFCQIFLFLPKIIPSIRQHADILKPTWVDASLHLSYQHDSNYTYADHNYHRFNDT